MLHNPKKPASAGGSDERARFTARLQAIRDQLLKTGQFDEELLKDGFEQALRHYGVKSDEPELRDLGLKFFHEIEPNPVKNWLIEDLLPEEGLSFLYGPPGAGKSFVAGDLAYHVAGFFPTWFGMRVTNCAVLYVAAERKAVVERRFAALRKAKPLPTFRIMTDRYDATDEGVRITPEINDVQWEVLPLGIVGDVDMRSSDADTRAIIRDAIEVEWDDLPIGLVIIDTHNRAMAGGNENASEDNGALLANAKKIQEELRCHVMFVDHTPIADDGRIRGHTSKLGAADVTICVKATGDLTRSFSVTKSNEGDESLQWAFRLNSVELGTHPRTGKVTTAGVVEQIEAPKAANDNQPEDSKLTRQLLKAMRGCASSFFDAMPFGADGPRVRAVLVDLVRAEFIASHPSDRPGTRRNAWSRALKLPAVVLRHGYTHEGRECSIMWQAKSDLALAMGG